MPKSEQFANSSHFDPHKALIIHTTRRDEHYSNNEELALQCANGRPAFWNPIKWQIIDVYLDGLVGEWLEDGIETKRFAPWHKRFAVPSSRTWWRRLMRVATEYSHWPLLSSSIEYECMILWLARKGFKGQCTVPIRMHCMVPLASYRRRLMEDTASLYQRRYIMDSVKRRYTCLILSSATKKMIMMTSERLIECRRETHCYSSIKST
jgi:hypothetical protein